MMKYLSLFILLFLFSCGEDAKKNVEDLSNTIDETVRQTNEMIDQGAREATYMLDDTGRRVNKVLGAVGEAVSNEGSEEEEFEDAFDFTR